VQAVRPYINEVLGHVFDAHKRNAIAFAVEGIIKSGSVVSAKIAENGPGEAYTKHKIKRMWRLLRNEGICADSISESLIRAFSISVGERVLLTLDWTTIGPFEMMTTSVVSGGRALPFQWTAIDMKTRMAVGQKMHVRRLRRLLPDGVDFILLFDAGYDDVWFLKELVELGLKFVIRSTPQVCIRPRNEDWLKLTDFKFERGRLYDWGWVDYTKGHAFPIRGAAIHDFGQKDPWILVSNVHATAQELVKFYGRRFETEETYKDWKDLRNGMQLKNSRIRNADNLVRLCAILSLAYLLMSLVGLEGEAQGKQRRYQANTVKHKRVLAVWRLGKRLLTDEGVIFGQYLLSRLWSHLQELSRQFGGGKWRSSSYRWLRSG